MVALIDRLERWSILTAEAAGLEWKGNGTRIIEIEQELASLQHDDRFFDRRAMEPIFPLFHSVDEGQLSGGFFRTLPGFTIQACSILDVLAARICEESPVPVGHRGGSAGWHLALYTFGVDIVAPCFDVLRSSLASVHYTHARLVRHDDDAPETAPIGTDDHRFDEVGIVDCAGDAEHATLIARFAIDEEPLAPVMEMIEARGNAARRILRGCAA